MSQIINEDLRSIKTERALYSAIFSLLKKVNFKRITVKGICEEALISRAAFYAHFIDKYDLLKHWLAELWTNNFNRNNTYDQMELVINRCLRDNTKMIKNVFNDADSETIKIINDFILSIKHMDKGEKNGLPLSCENVVISSFYAGGIISYLLWQVKNDFPKDVPLMNRAIYKMFNEFKDR